jgi:amidase
LTLELATPGHAPARPATHLVRRSGAVILGFTHSQSGNRRGNAVRSAVQTPNPWDPDHTAGSVGSAAAVAAGLAPLAFGSDDGGQTCLAAAYCGVYAHRPSEPAAHYRARSTTTPPELHGIVSRSADDLEFGVQLLGTATGGVSASWWLQARPRHTTLADFRVALLPSLGETALNSEVAAAYHAFLTDLRRAGVRITELPRSLGGAIVARPEEAHDLRTAGLIAQREIGRPHGALFSDWDILLAPAVSAPAPRLGSAAELQGPARDAGVAPGHARGLPLTVFPISLTRSLLPIACCAIGPYLEDRTSIRFAALVQEMFGGYNRPPGYGSVH